MRKSGANQGVKKVRRHGAFPLRSLQGMLLLAVLLAAVMALSLLLGSTRLGLQRFWAALLRLPGSGNDPVIVYGVRLPRMLAGVLAGAGLSVSGVLLQAVTGNDLAGPNIIGVNSGAGFVMILTLSFFPLHFGVIPLAAFAGALGTATLIVAAANRMGAGKADVILAGIALTTLLNAGISLLSLLDSDVLAMYNSFSIGGFAGVRSASLAVPAAIIAVGSAGAMLMGKKIDLLCLGDELAGALGVRVKLVRTVCLICACACAAAVVSFAGLLGFVGLVVPHIARLLVGASMRWQLACAMLCGGILVVAADLFGRILLAPTEIPVGIVMAVIGAPFFLWLLLKRRRTNA